MIDKCVAGYVLSIRAEGSWQIVKGGAKSERISLWNNKNPQNVSPQQLKWDMSWHSLSAVQPADVWRENAHNGTVIAG